MDGRGARRPARDARTRETVGAVGARATARARPPRGQPAHRAAQRRDPGARLRPRCTAVGGPVCARCNGGRKRHVFPLGIGRGHASTPSTIKNPLPPFVFKKKKFKIVCNGVCYMTTPYF